MKLTLINNLYPPYVLGGAERSVQFVSEALAKRGHQIIVVCIVPDQFTRIKRLNGVKVYYMGIKKFRILSALFKGAFKKYPKIRGIMDIYNPWAAAQLSKILDREKPDLVNTNNLAGFSISAWHCIKQKGYKIVHTLRDYYLICPRSTMFKKGVNCDSQCLVCRLFVTPRPYLSNFVDAVIGNSRFILNRHLDFGFFSSVPIRDVIYNIYEPLSRTIKLNHPPQKPIRFGYIGRLKKKKGIYFLFDALFGLEKRDWELWIAGEKMEIRNLNLAYESSSRVKFMGFIDPASFFSKIDILVVPSLWHDPLPRTIFEAYAHGIPVIGSDKGGIPEIINHGETGFIYLAEDIKALQKILIYFIANPSTVMSMQNNCLNRSMDFSSDAIAHRYLNLYSSLVNR